MYLSRLIVKNYRSINNLDLEFAKGKNIIVGKNNAGKSNIIKAIDLVLGESSPTWNKSENITDNDFHLGKNQDDIFIWCELQRDTDLKDGLESFDFTEVQKTAIAKIVNGDRDNKLG